MSTICLLRAPSLYARPIDEFTRFADGTPIHGQTTLTGSQTWTEEGNGNQIKVVGGRLTVSAITAVRWALLNYRPTSGVQDVEFDWFTGAQAAPVTVEMNYGKQTHGEGDHRYSLTFAHNEFDLFRYDGNFTNLGTTQPAITWAANTVQRVRAVWNPATGVITAYVNGVQVAQVTDPSPMTYYPGIYFGGWTGNQPGNTGTPDQYFDNLNTLGSVATNSGWSETNGRYSTFDTLYEGGDSQYPVMQIIDAPDVGVAGTVTFKQLGTSAYRVTVSGYTPYTPVFLGATGTVYTLPLQAGWSNLSVLEPNQGITVGRWFGGSGARTYR